MAESSFQDKTEQPTGKRLEDARKEGNVVKSADVSSAASLLAGAIGLLLFGRGMVDLISTAFHVVIFQMGSLELNADLLPGQFRTAAGFMLKLLGPFLLLLTGVGLASHILQSGWNVAPKALTPKLSRLSPMQNIKRTFSSRGVVELLKGLVKIIVVSWIGYRTIKAEVPALIPLMDEEVGQVIAAIGDAALKLALRLTIAFALLAVLDFAFQKWKHVHDLKMTKQEVKEEHRQLEGDPQIKGKIRQLQLQTSLNRMIKQIPKADVVVANPVHVAVALQYDPTIMSAPRVVAKGQRKIAERIKAIAREHGIPIIEEPELARALFKSAEVGWEIPYELYQAVAEVLAMVYRLRQAA